MSECLMLETKANGMIFRGRSAGLDNPSGEPVIFLHGFPETSIMWANLMAKLADEGYRCFAPDQRGYSPGARPEKVERYAYRELASDVVALADALGFRRFHMVGHDWGSAIGWIMLDLYPDRVHSWTAMSVPHMNAFRSAIADDPDQRKRSQYMILFMMPDEPEKVLTADNFKVLRDLWSAIPQNQLEEYLAVFSRPMALTAALNWYRANPLLLKRGDQAITFGPVSHPTLLIWGNQDLAVGRVAVEQTRQYMKGQFRLIELNAGHWLIQEEPGAVHDEILRHLQSNRLP